MSPCLNGVEMSRRARKAGKAGKAASLSGRSTGSLLVVAVLPGRGHGPGGCERPLRLSCKPSLRGSAMQDCPVSQRLNLAVPMPIEGQGALWIHGFTEP